MRRLLPSHTPLTSHLQDAAYTDGMAKDVFLKDVTGKPYVGQVCSAHPYITSNSGRVNLVRPDAIRHWLTAHVANAARCGLVRSTTQTSHTQPHRSGGPTTSRWMEVHGRLPDLTGLLIVHRRPCNAAVVDMQEFHRQLAFDGIWLDMNECVQLTC